MGDMSGKQTDPGRAGVAPYAGGRLDRAAALRADARRLALLRARPDTRVVPLWQDDCVVRGDPPRAVVLTAAPAQRVLDAAEVVFLGLDGGVGVFAADLSDLDRAAALALAGGDATASVRTAYAAHTAGEAALLGYARGLVHWARHQRHCGSCGAPAEARDGGHVRACTGCGRLLFPRLEPAVIMLVESAAEPRRCLLARHRGSGPDGFSTLAGFVEVGESLEDAVRREVAEEAGLTVGAVAYAGSQPWPFPAGLMVAFHATAVDDVPVVDGDEIIEARWFTREELAGRAAGGRLGSDDSIDRLLLRSWLAGP